MKKILPILVFLSFGMNLSSQNTKINNKIKIDSTVLKLSLNGQVDYIYSTYDNKNTDSLVFSIGEISKEGIPNVRIDFSKIPKVYINIRSDYPQYDGNYDLKIEFEHYYLEINSVDLKNGDILMGRLKGKSEKLPTKLGGYQINIDGEFKHIIGKSILSNGERTIIINN